MGPQTTTQTCPNPEVRKWAKALHRRLSGMGLHISGLTHNVSRGGWYSSYFGVVGVGEVRISDHPINAKHPTSDVSIGDAGSFEDLCCRYVLAHNELHPVKLEAVDEKPYILRSSEVDYWRRSKAEAAERRETRRLAAHLKEIESQDQLRATKLAKKTFWDDQVARSDIEGPYKFVVARLKACGVRFPDCQALDNEPPSEPPL